jgi:hypothetical protein
MKGYKAERTIGGAIVYDTDGNPLDKHTEVASLSPRKFDWGPDADDEAVLQLALALLTDRRSWVTAIKHYRDVAAYIQDEYGDQDEWRMQRGEVTGAAMDGTGAERFDQYLPQPGEVDIDDVDLDEIDLATEGALCERYDITLVSRDSDRREELETVRDDGVSALHADEDVPCTELDEYNTDDDAASDERDDEHESSTTDTSADSESEPAASEREETATGETADADVEESATSESSIDAAGEDTSPTASTAECEEGEPAATAEPEAEPDAAEGSTDSPRSAVPATVEQIQTAFPEVTAEMATGLAASRDTIDAIRAATPRELLDHEAVDRKTMTRLCETISWSVTTPVGKQRPDPWAGESRAEKSDAEEGIADDGESDSQPDAEQGSSECEPTEPAAAGDGSAVDGPEAFEWVDQDKPLHAT